MSQNPKIKMHISLIEPISPRYIYINPKTNQVHLMVPIVGGQEISTDNTCKATLALREFFDGGALHELNAYKNALAFDISLLEESHPQCVDKKNRLAQIEAYKEAVQAMRYRYADSMGAFLTRPSNLYGIQLRPRAQDSQSRVVNPAFHIERRNDTAGIPLSPLYHAMHCTFPSVRISVAAPYTALIHGVSNTLPTSPSFEDIQRILRDQCFALFGLSIDFTKRSDGTPAAKPTIDALMGFGTDATLQDYIDALIGVCAPNIWENIPTPPFYSIPTATSVYEKTERLSILTQFFLANLTIYCKAKGISTQNFGAILDASSALSNDLVGVIATALSSGDDVERQLCAFCNVYATEFGLSRSLNAEDLTAIKQKFERTYRTVTATKENPHMDDFMILDMEATGETAKFVIHQGSICVNFAEIVDAVAASANPGYFSSIRTDFATHPAEISHKNEWVTCTVDIEPETLLARINDDQFETLPEVLKEASLAYPPFQTRQFLHDVAKGKQREAKVLLTAKHADTQTLLRIPGVFTDYSGRTFNCTAYEYAYWAKDTHMCRMLEQYMDDKTKAEILARVDEMERTDTATGQKIGLVYQQHGATHCSAHFDFTPLKQALQHYINNYGSWNAAYNCDGIKAAWRVVGKAQRDLPAHVAQEYCRPDRSFNPTPQFNEDTLPRVLTFYNSKTGYDESWFPLPVSNSGLGFDFALIRMKASVASWEGGGARQLALLDLAAITHLDEVRAEDLSFSREHLTALENSLGMKP